MILGNISISALTKRLLYVQTKLTCCNFIIVHIFLPNHLQLQADISEMRPIYAHWLELLYFLGLSDTVLFFLFIERYID